MTIEKKLLGTSPSGGSTDVADVFSTFLYKGTGSNRTINNGIDLAGEGGLIWIKAREDTVSHALFDTVRGVHEMLVTDTNAGQDNKNTSVTAFNSNGFNLGSGYEVNEAAPNEEYVSWTFRKKEKFFTCLSYTGNGTSSPQISQAVSHDLGSVPAMMITKQSNGQNNWTVYHKNIGNTHELVLNETGGKAANQSAWNNTSPTDAVFTVGAGSNTTNKSGQTYIAYLFADNSSEDADDQMIKCGTVSGQQTINLGWEPQFLLMKKTSGSGDWRIIDSMRGFTVKDKNDAWLKPNTNATESTGDFVGINSTGFFSDLNGDYIFCAIRAEMMKEPEAATEVYKGDYWNNSTPYTINTGFTTDLLVYIRNIEAGSNHWFVDRLRGETARIDFSATTAESTWTHTKLDVSNGYTGTLAANGGNKNLTYAFSRAKGCFDILNYTGNSSSSQNVPHQLGVIPEFVINVRRDNGSKYVVSTAIGTDVMVGFNNQGSLDPRDPNDFFDTPTDTLLKPLGAVNSNGKSYINYLFATLDGVSKCGKYIGNGSSQTIDCGFAAGARFIMLKCVSVGSNQGVNTTAWYVWDSARGIVSGNDPYFKLNTASAMVSNTDSIDPTSSGFIVNQNSTTEINNTGRTYIYLAIA